MATQEANRLTLTHRRAQLAIRARTIQDLLRLWPAFDINGMQRTWPPFERALLTLVKAREATSAGLATRYYEEFRTLAEVGGSATPRIFSTPDEVLAGGLLFNGPVTISKELAKARPIGVVRDAALVNLSGEVSRFVLNGGRGSILESVKADRQALGWARVTSGNACAFCSMLASRGPVYKRETVDFSAHRACACSGQPVYGRDDWAPGSREMKSKWDEATVGLSGAEARNAFRRSLAA